MKASLLFVVLVFFAIFGAVRASSPPPTAYYSGTFYINAFNDYRFQEGIIDPENGAAWGFFNDTIATTGWGHLVVHTAPSYSDIDQSFAAGYVEGALTSYRIAQHYANLMDSFGFSDGIPTNIVQFLEQQDEWLSNNLNSSANVGSYWKQLRAISAQLNGLAQGYNSTASQPLTYLQLLALNSAGDLFDIIPALNYTNSPSLFDLPPEELLDLLARRSHCSFLAKILGDYSDLYFAHTTWFSYTWMLRIFKEYNISLSTSNAPSVLFSAYPGTLSSIDDFYSLSSGLLVSETTNSILNMSIYENVVPQTVLSWQRVIAANRLAYDGPSWADYFSQYNSGTYNNQWIVLDYNLFTPGTPLQDNTLWILEQIPGFIQASDETDILRFGYWPSYNVPYFPEILEKSGWNYEFIQTGNSQFTHELAPRAQIFRRDQDDAIDLATFQTLMRENNYQTDPYSHGDPSEAIASRYDLRTYNAFAFGAVDTKIISWNLFYNQSVLAISGPTTNGGTLPPFSWDNWAGSHEGQPSTFDFDWQTFQPTTF